jgi:MFS family permease
MNFFNEQRKIIALSSLGGMLEYYDFITYGVFAIYFSKLFFPNNNSLVSILAAYSIFFIGYIIRPIGGVILSHIGDEYGRKRVMVITMVLMGISSFGIGILPTYATIGIAAPILLLLFRILQGLAFGGEISCIIIYISETISSKKARTMRLVFALMVSGLLIAMLLHLFLVHVLTMQQIVMFGWRIGFILGGLVCFISYQVRKKLYETNAFKNIKSKHKYPFVVLIRRHLAKVFIGIALIASMAAASSMSIIFMPTYLVAFMKLSNQQVGNTIIVGLIAYIIAIYFSGYVLDKFEVTKVMLVNLIILILMTPLAYWLLKIHFNLPLTLFLFNFCVGLVVTPAIMILAKLFPTNISLTGVAISYNLGYILFAGVYTFLVVGLITKFNHIFLIPVIAIWLIALTSIYALMKYKKIINSTKPQNI